MTVAVQLAFTLQSEAIARKIGHVGALDGAVADRATKQLEEEAIGGPTALIVQGAVGRACDLLADPALKSCGS